MHTTNVGKKECLQLMLHPEERRPDLPWKCRISRRKKVWVSCNNQVTIGSFPSSKCIISKDPELVPFPMSVNRYLSLPWRWLFLLLSFLKYTGFNLLSFICNKTPTHNCLTPVRSWWSHCKTANSVRKLLLSLEENPSTHLSAFPHDFVRDHPRLS